MKFCNAVLLSLLSAGLVWSAEVAAETYVNRLELQAESEVFARRGDAVVTQADFDVYLNRLPAHHRAEFLSHPERIGEVLQALMIPRQIRVLAEEDGLLESQELQNELLQSATMKVADYYMEHHWQAEKLDDYSQQARELYLTRQDLIRRPVHVDFTHVLVLAPPGGSEVDAIRRIMAVYDEMDEGKSLGELAASHSDDPSVDDNQGRFEHVELESLEGQVRRMIEFLEPGQVSEPFRSSNGWHVLELHDRYRPDIESFDQVQERAKQVAEGRHREQVRERLLAELNNAPVVFTDGAVETLLSRYPSTESDVEALTREVRQRMGLQ